MLRDLSLVIELLCYILSFAGFFTSHRIAGLFYPFSMPGKKEKKYIFIINSSASYLFTSDGYSALVNFFSLFFLADVSPTFSPLAICVLQKCLRLLTSESGSFTLPEKSIISLYVCNTLKYLMQTQVNISCFSFIIACSF